MKFLLLLALLLTTVSAAAPDTPYWQWTRNQAKQYQSAARERLKSHPDSVEALDQLAQSIVVLSYSNPGRDQLTELLSVLKRSYRLSPSQTTAVLLARYCEDNTASAEWAVKALAYPHPSLRALDYFENLLKNDPKLARLVNEDVRRARLRRQRWQAILASYGTVKNDMFTAYSRESVDRRLPGPVSVVKVQGKSLEARSKDGELLWSREVGSEPVKVVSFEAAIATINESRLDMLDPPTGRAIHSLPLPLKTNLKDGKESVEWNAWTAPELLLGLDKERFYVAVSHWFCVFRSKDGTGWARYFSYSVRAVPCPDNRVLIVQTHENRVVAHNLSDGKELWTFTPPGNQPIDLRKVTDAKVVVYLPGLERLVVLDRDTGTVMERLSFETLG